MGIQSKKITILIQIFIVIFVFYFSGYIFRNVIEDVIVSFLGKPPIVEFYNTEIESNQLKNLLSNAEVWQKVPLLINTLIGILIFFVCWQLIPKYNRKKRLIFFSIFITVINSLILTLAVTHRILFDVESILLIQAYYLIILVFSKQHTQYEVSGENEATH